MTDAESFYLVLALFYFIECLKLRPPGTTALANAFGQGNSWSPRSELVRLMGIGKWVFLAPILPWPGLMIVSAIEPRGKGASKKISSPLRIKRLSYIFKKHAFGLRILSAAIFCFFFLLLPHLYFLQRGTPIFIVSIGVGYLLMLAAAWLQFRIRRRLFPDSKTLWITQSLYTALLPWHAMRCSDEIFMEYTRHWSWPAILAAHIDSPQSRSQLLRLWREAQWNRRANYSIDELKPIFDKVNLNTETFEFSANERDAPKYCPSCLTSYQSSAIHCADCHEIELLNRK